MCILQPTNLLGVNTAQSVPMPCVHVLTQLWWQDVDLVSLQLQRLELDTSIDGAGDINNVIVSENQLSEIKQHI